MSASGTPSTPLAAHAWATDPSVGARVAVEWVTEHHAGRQVARTRTHSLLCRGPHDVSARVAVVLDGDDPGAELTLLVRDRRGAVSVREFPDDPGLPTLAAVLRDGALTPLLRAAGLGCASGATPSSYETDVVHHPREGACVLRVRVGGDEAYAKVYPRGEDAAAAAQRLYAVGTDRLSTSRGQVVRLPRVLAASPSLRATVLGSLAAPEASGGSAPQVAPVALEDVAGALAALHAHHPSGRLPVLPAGVHVQRVLSERRLVGTLWPELAQSVDDAICTAASVLEAAAPGGAVLCHGDLTPGQVVQAAGGLGLLDLDTASLDDPASDIGRFLAYEQVRAARLDASPQQAGTAAKTFLTAYGTGPGDGAEDLDRRVWAHRRLNLALIALRAARRFKDARSALALRLLDATGAIPGRH